MTVAELVEALKAVPPDACVVFRHTRDDIPDEYETVDVFCDRGEVFVDIHSGEDDE